MGVGMGVSTGLKGWKVLRRRLRDHGCANAGFSSRRVPILILALCPGLAPTPPCMHAGMRCARACTLACSIASVLSRRLALAGRSWLEAWAAAWCGSAELQVRMPELGPVLVPGCTSDRFGRRDPELVPRCACRGWAAGRRRLRLGQGVAQASGQEQWLQPKPQQASTHAHAHTTCTNHFTYFPF